MSARLSAAVVVCTATHEREPLLRGCVRSLLAGERVPDEILIVVDQNASLEATLSRWLPAPAKLLRTERPGNSEARNVGIRAATSDVVAFVDDDAAVEPDWLSSTMAPFEASGDVLGVGGAVLPDWGTGRRRLPEELLWTVGCTYRGHREDPGPIRNPIGCNMAFRRRELLALGAFAPEFGKRGDALVICDETELGLRLERTYGPGRIRYVPSARVRHHVPPARLGWRALARRCASEGLSKGRLHRAYRGAALRAERGYVRRLLLDALPGRFLGGIVRRDRSSLAGAAAILLSLVVTSASFVAGATGAHLRVPLFREGYALVLNSLLAALFGLVYWLLAARHYTPHALGLNAAAISVMMFLAGISQLNLMGALMRFLPVAGRRSERFVLLAYLISVAVAAVVTAVFLLGLQLWAPDLGFLTSSLGFALWFAAATMAWCVFNLQDSVLTGLRAAVFVPLENLAFSLVKIALLVALVAASPHYGIFASWTVALLASLVPVNLLIFRRLLPRHVGNGDQRGSLPSRHQLARFVSADYLGSLFWLAAITLMPVIVLAAEGAGASAHFSLAWMIALPIFTISANTGSSLVVTASGDEAGLPAYARKVLAQTAGIVIPLALGVALAAPLVLRLFGTEYAANSAVTLELLALSTIPHVVVFLYLSVYRVQRRMSALVTLLGALCGLVLILGVVLLQVLGIAGVGLAWLLAESIVAAALLVTQPRTLWPARRGVVAVEST